MVCATKNFRDKKQIGLKNLDWSQSHSFSTSINTKITDGTFEEISGRILKSNSGGVLVGNPGRIPDGIHEVIHGQVLEGLLIGVLHEFLKNLPQRTKKVLKELLRV